MYCATQTRPDVAYSVGMLARAMGKPTPELYQQALRASALLPRAQQARRPAVPARGRTTVAPLSGMSELDWAVKHSTSGMCFKYMSAAISWASKKQATVALSSCEAEIVAASEAAKEAISLRGLCSTTLASATRSPLVSMSTTSRRSWLRATRSIILA